MANRKYIYLLHKKDCPFCKSTIDNIYELKLEDRIKLIEKDTQKGKEIREKYNIHSAPTFIFEDGTILTQGIVNLEFGGDERLLTLLDRRIPGRSKI